MRARARTTAVRLLRNIMRGGASRLRSGISACSYSVAAASLSREGGSGVLWQLVRAPLAVGECCRSSCISAFVLSLQGLHRKACIKSLLTFNILRAMGEGLGLIKWATNMFFSASSINVTMPA